MTKKERAAAMAAIEPYSRTVSDPKYVKKARTWLSDKIYNDEFEQPGGGGFEYKPPENPVDYLD